MDRTYAEKIQHRYYYIRMEFSGNQEKAQATGNREKNEILGSKEK